MANNKETQTTKCEYPNIICIPAENQTSAIPDSKSPKDYTCVVFEETRSYNS